MKADPEIYYFIDVFDFISEGCYYITYSNIIQGSTLTPMFELPASRSK